MKIIILFYIKIISYILCQDKPTISVNYLPKKQWKLSKHDIADIKLDIERELKDRIIQIQREWELRERNQQYQVLNQGMQYPLYVPPVNYYPTYPNIPINNGGLNQVGINYDQNNANHYDFHHSHDHDHDHNHHDHLSIHELMDKLDNVIARESKIGLNKFMSATLNEVKDMKAELQKMKRDRDEETPKITNEYHYETNVTLPDNKSLVLKFKQQDIDYNLNSTSVIDNDKNRLTRIINKYKSNEAIGKLNLFFDISKKINSTVIKKIKIDTFSKKIDQAVKNNKNLLKNFSIKENSITIDPIKETNLRKVKEVNILKDQSQNNKNEIQSSKSNLKAYFKILRNNEIKPISKNVNKIVYDGPLDVSNELI